MPRKKPTDERFERRLLGQTPAELAAQDALAARLGEHWSSWARRILERARRDEEARLEKRQLKIPGT